MTLKNDTLGKLYWLPACLLLALWAPGEADAQLYGRNVARPYFDYPTAARYSNCRWCPPAWGFDPFAAPGGPCSSQAGGDCGCQECDGCGPTNSCLDGFIAHRPNNWYGGSELAPLTLDWGRDVDFARIGPAGATVISTSHLDNEFDAGGRWMIGKVLNPCWRVEGSYSGDYSWDDLRAVRNLDVVNAVPGNLSSLLSGFADPGVAGVDFNNYALLESHSRYAGAELNFKYWVDVPPGPMDISLLVGFRYVNFDEFVHFRTESAAPVNPTVNDLNLRTFNDLYGVQIGIEGAFMVSPHWWIDAGVKGALMQNFAEVSSSYNGAAALGVAQDRTSFLGDVVVTANVQITPDLVLKAGYQATFLTGVAIAAQNVPTSTNVLLNGPTNLDDRGEAAIHGPILGLIYNR